MFSIYLKLHIMLCVTLCFDNMLEGFFEASEFYVVRIQGISIRGLGICGPTVVLLSTRYFVCGLSMDMTHAPYPSSS